MAGQDKNLVIEGSEWPLASILIAFFVCFTICFCALADCMKAPIENRVDAPLSIEKGGEE